MRAGYWRFQGKVPAKSPAARLPHLPAPFPPSVDEIAAFSKVKPSTVKSTPETPEGTVNIPLLPVGVVSRIGEPNAVPKEGLSEIVVSAKIFGRAPRPADGGAPHGRQSCGAGRGLYGGTAPGIQCAFHHRHGDQDAVVWEGVK